MIALCITSFNKEYDLNNVLKTKQKDINVKDIVNKLKTIFTNEDDKDKIHKFIQ